MSILGELRSLQVNFLIRQQISETLHLVLYFYQMISEDIERRQILQIVADHYLRFQEHCKAMLVALQLGDSDLVHKCLTTCSDHLMRKQLSYILVRQRVTRQILYASHSQNTTSRLCNLLLVRGIR